MITINVRMQHGSPVWVHDDETAGLAPTFIARHFWASPKSDRRFWYFAVLISSILGIRYGVGCWQEVLPVELRLKISESCNTLLLQIPNSWQC